jgi:flagellar hook-length control protein FliK
VAASGAVAVAAATAISDSGLNSNSQSDGNDNGNSAAAGSDRSGATSTVANTDLSALASLARALPAGAAQSGSVEHLIPVPVSDQNWPHAVAAQLQLFAAANVQNATLRLSPEHLGPVEVHIDVQASQVNVSFVAAHAETRSALEQALPTLRTMLAHGGLTLGQTQVQGESRSASQSFNARAHGVFGAAPVEGPAAAGPARAVGLIDEYA